MTDLPIVFEDEQLIVINKPALIHSVSLAPSDRSIASFLRDRSPSLALVSDHQGDSGLINRLDFETSGLLIAAKSRSSWELLRRQFQQNAIQKTYRALVRGVPEAPLIIEGYLGNRYRGSKKVTVQNFPEKRFLYTRSEIISVDPVPNISSCALVTISTETGARHQIRAHCALRGHTLVGDTLYGDSGEKPPSLKDPALPPFLLHALSARLTHPQSDQLLVLQAPLPSYYP